MPCENHVNSRQVQCIKHVRLYVCCCIKQVQFYVCCIKHVQFYVCCCIKRLVIKCVENALLGQAVYVQIFFFLLFFFVCSFFSSFFSFFFFPFFFFPLPPFVDRKLPAEVVELGRQEVHTNSFGGSFVGLLLITHLSNNLYPLFAQDSVHCLKESSSFVLVVNNAGAHTHTRAQAHTHTHMHMHTQYTLQQKM